MTRVLIAEDSRTQAARLTLLLEADGYEVEVVGDGAQALERCRTRPFDAVLSDVVMPGLSGYELCRALKAEAVTKDLPVILLTTLRDPTNIIEALECGADNFITKPYEPGYILERVRTILAQRQRRAQRLFSAGVEIVFMGKRFTITSDKEQILGLLVATFEDILRASRELEASHGALREAERERQAKSEQLARTNKDLEAFVYTISHDLKEPLRGIDAFSRFLLEDYARLLDDQGTRYLDLLRDSAIRMTQLIDDLLRFSRVGRQGAPLVAVDLGTVVREAVQEVRFSADEAGALIELPAELPTIVGYPVLIRQLFANLLGNALKYRRADVRPHVVVGCEAVPGGVEVTVADNGIGVPPEHRELVFGLFQRLHRREDYAGTGVGLALCKKIAEEHAGTIGIEETPGGGCTVRVTLCARPVLTGDAAAQPAATEA